MNIFKIAALGVVGTVLAVILKTNKPEFAIGISITTGIAIFMLIKNDIYASINAMSEAFYDSGIDFSYFGVVLKVIGVSYITMFSSEMCRDAGQNAIASKVELGGKIIIFTAAMPVVLSLIRMLVGIVA